MKLGLMLCCNDYRNGAYTGQADRIDVDLQPLMQLEGPAVSCTSDGRSLKIDGLRFALKGYAEWVGNWCWDRAVLESVHVARIVNHLRDKGWDVFSAESRLFEKFRNGENITVSDLEALAWEADNA